MRHLTKYAQDRDLVKNLLGKLIDIRTGVDEYADSFYQLGKELWEAIQSTYKIDHGKLMLASSSEDADWLSKGILDKLSMTEFETSLAVFWNLRANPIENTDLTIAPIIKTYIEPIENIDYLIVTKSIISSSCIVRTNLTFLIERIDPSKIFITAPVLFEKAVENLIREFPGHISKKFEFIYFAVDDEINDRNEVVPGIGGSVYQRLGLGNSTTKNKYTPAIVKERRSKFINH